jgi:hypothetical protein
MSLPSVKITILELTPDARPAAVLFHFNTPLEDQSLQWICWRTQPKPASFPEWRSPGLSMSIRSVSKR